MYYEDNVKVKIDWKGLILKLVAVVLIILVAVWLFPMPKLDTFYSRVYNENLNSMKSVAEKYFVNDNLPAKTGSSNTLKLQDMIDKKLITEFTDKNNKECSSTNSFAQVTKTENDNYVLKIQLSCDDKTDYVLETLNTSNTGNSNSNSNSSANNSNSNTNNNTNSNNSNNNSTSNNTKKSSTNDKDEDDGIEIDKSIINSGDSKYDKGGSVEYEYKRAITKTSTTYTCPDGYVKDNNVCYKYDTGETIPATALYFDDVVISTDAKKNTTGGYTKTAEVIKTEVSSEDVCPEGYTKNGNICYKYINATVVPGTTTYSCPDGYTLNGTSCVTTASRVETKGDATYYCPSGYTLVGNSCVTTTNRIETRGQDTYTCPDGYVLNGTKCVSTVSRIENPGKLVYSCPSGYVLNGSVCTRTINRTVNTNYTYTCPSGYTLSADKSRCTYTTSATKVTTPGATTCRCPSGYNDNGSNCYKQTTYTGAYHAGTTTYSSCPSGWSASGNQCVQAAKVTVTWTNPQHTTSKTQLSEYNNGTTKRVRNGSPSCNASGCTYSYTTYTAKNNYTCPNGGSISGSNCVKSRSSSTSSSYYTCNDGRQQSSSTCYTTSYVNKTCTTGKSTVSYTCPNGYSKNGTSCTLTKSSTRNTNVTYTCPSGYYQSGNSCVHTTNANVNRTETTYSCPSGYYMNGTSCERVTDATKNSGSVSYSCPSGYYTKGDVCEKAIEASKKEGSTSYSCPSGYAMKGDTCEKTIGATPHTTETEYTCPSGYVKKGTTCYQYTEPTKKKTYSYECPTGYKKEGTGEETKCTLYVETTTTLYCESAEEELIDGKCVKTVKGGLKGYTCPNGYILNNDQCVLKTLDCAEPIAITNTSTTYEYKWSSESSIDGWSQTGKTRSTNTSSENLYDK